LGQPCAVADPVAAYIRADRQRNVAVFGSGGSDDDDAAGLLTAAALSFAAQQSDGKLILINALPPVSRYQTLPEMITAAAPGRTTLIDGSQGTTARDAAVARIVALAGQVEQNITPTLIVGFGYHYLDITKKQDPETAAKMTALLTDGPHRHMWTVAWWDDLRTYKEVFGDNLELFGARVMLTNAVHDARHLVNDPRRKDLRENRGVFWDRDDRNNPVTFMPYHPPETAVQLTRWANRVGITS
jgi:hypothetical protein